VNGTIVPARYRAAWTLLVIAVLVVVGLWSVRVSASLGSGQDAAPIAVPTPSATVAPLIATVYSNIGPPNPATLCAELSPQPKEVTVESTSGAVLETLTCRH
jgi:hypothetical protein